MSKPPIIAVAFFLAVFLALIAILPWAAEISALFSFPPALLSTAVVAALGSLFVTGNVSLLKRRFSKWKIYQLALVSSLFYLLACALVVGWQFMSGAFITAYCDGVASRVRKETDGSSLLEQSLRELENSVGPVALIRTNFSKGPFKSICNGHSATVATGGPDDVMVHWSEGTLDIVIALGGSAQDATVSRGRCSVPLSTNITLIVVLR